MLNRHPQLLQGAQTALLIVDVQEKLMPHIWKAEALLERLSKLIQGCQILRVPIFITEQYPKGLGATVPPIQALLQHQVAAEKLVFSCCGVDSLGPQMAAQKVKQVVVVGVETHVCVQQTALDLLHRQLQVHVPRDAVSSRKELDYQTALERMGRTGAIITTVETVLFELLERAGTPEFKQISHLVR